jgi:hypothetical protein
LVFKLERVEAMSQSDGSCHLSFRNVRDGVTPGKDPQHATVVLCGVKDDAKAGLEPASVSDPLEHGLHLLSLIDQIKRDLLSIHDDLLRAIS